jgi:hypothetical protein
MLKQKPQIGGKPSDLRLEAHRKTLPDKTNLLIIRLLHSPDLTG